MIKRNPLLMMLGSATLLFLAANLLMVPWSHRLMYARKLKNIRDAQNPNLLFIGNSMLDGHVDEPLFSATARACDVSFTPLNAALGAVQPPEERLLFQYATDRHSQIRTLVIGYFDFQLTAEDRVRPADLTGNQMVAINPTVPMHEVKEAYQFNEFQQLQVELLRLTPVAANRVNAWRNVELLRRDMQQMGMPPIATNSMGRVADFAALGPRSPEQFDREVAAFLAHPDHFSRSYEFVFDQARRSGIRTVVVLLPVSPTHLRVVYHRTSWLAYSSAIETLARSRGIEFIDATSWVTAQRDFNDDLHMVDSGIEVFTKRLAQALACGGDCSNPDESPNGMK